MNTFGQALANTSKRRPPANPFAQALADTEREQHLGSGSGYSDTSAFGDALSRTGGSMSDAFADPAANDWEEQQRIWEEQRKKDALRKKLHDQINPVDTIDVFRADEQKTKQEIEQVRKELEMLVKDIAKFHKEVDLTLKSNVVSPGKEGKYYKSFFHKLRAFIMLLRQRINSARTWATQMNTKKKKKQSKAGVGMMIAGQGHEQTHTVQDMMHHERSSMYSGG